MAEIFNVGVYESSGVEDNKEAKGKMKNILKSLVCLVVIVALQSSAAAQIGYSITDNNRDVTNLDQQYYQFDLVSGQGTLLSTLTLNGQQIRREYEGLASSGSVLFGVAEFDTFTCDDPSADANDPITGLASDVRIFRVPGAYPLPNGVQNAIGPQIGKTCFPSGFTEAAAGYNPTSGFIVAVASDDTLPASAPRSRLFNISPTTGLATQIGAGATANGIILTAGSGGDENPYIDGLTVLPDGRIFGSENRFNRPDNAQPISSANPARGALYRLFAAGPNAGRATFVKPLVSLTSGRDTGLANFGNTLYYLLEDARVYTTGPDATSPVVAPSFPAGNPAGSNFLSTPGCLRTSPFCGDFEGFDIPVPALR